MQRSADIESVQPMEGPAESVLRTGKLLGRRSESHRQRLVGLVLVSSVTLLTLLAWEDAFVGQGVWGRGALSELTVARVIPRVAA